MIQRTVKSCIWMPLVLFCLFFIGFFVCYGIALALGHVAGLPHWPFVSDTGATPPESCIFTLLLTWASFFALATMYLYYKYVIYHSQQSKLNKAAFIIGCIACVGITMVGAFQWTAVLVPHLIGAFAAFVGSIVYSWLIVSIGMRQLVPHVHSMGIVYCRIAIATVETISTIVLIIGGGLSQTDEKYRNIATISEWLLIYGATFFLLTMFYELYNIRTIRTHIILHECTDVTSDLPPSTRIMPTSMNQL